MHGPSRMRLLRADSGHGPNFPMRAVLPPGAAMNKQEGNAASAEMRKVIDATNKRKAGG